MLATPASTDSGHGRKRPKLFRALGHSEPPLMVSVDGKPCQRVDIFKHDSWAATAVYQASDGQKIVCKFNRQSPIGLLSMRWLGRKLAKRERNFLQQLQGVRGIPEVFTSVQVNGHECDHAVAHDFIPGKPLSLSNGVRRDFFEKVEELLGELHSRRIAYVDLHKQENVIVGDDGLPYLIDFQVSVQLPKGRWGDQLLKMLRDGDLYNMDKHRWLHRRQAANTTPFPRPWWLQAHRCIGVPLRTLRRRFLVLIGVRRGNGSASTELAPEVGLRV
jgi:predicted Ser/Thr protein kinase